MLLDHASPECPHQISVEALAQAASEAAVVQSLQTNPNLLTSPAWMDAVILVLLLITTIVMGKLFLSAQADSG